MDQLLYGTRQQQKQQQQQQVKAIRVGELVPEVAPSGMHLI